MQKSTGIANAKRSIVAATLISFTVQMLPCSAAGLGFMNNFAAKKPASTMQIPINSKLDDSVMPEQPAAAAAPVDLTPVKLEDASKPAAAEAAPPSDATSGDNKGAVLNATVEQDTLMPHGPMDLNAAEAIKPMSVKNMKDSATASGSSKILQNATQVNAMPLALIPSEDEAEHKADTKQELERSQLTDLWDATLTRSPDMQFVVQKLMPTSDHSHVTSVMLNMLSMAISGGMNAAYLGSGAGVNPMTIMGAGTGANLIQGVLGSTSSRMAKKAQLSQTELIMLYNIIRTTADKLVGNFHDYKSAIAQVRRANSAFEDMQNEVRDARVGQSPSEQIKMDFVLKQAQGAIEEKQDTMGKYRQALTDLAGGDAVAKLDNQIEAEQKQLDETSAIANDQKAAETAPNDAAPAPGAEPPKQTAATPPASGSNPNPM